MRHRSVALLLLAGAGCWSPRHFAPRECLGASGPDGAPAAFYRVPAAEAASPSTGEVRIWSRGACARFTADDREVVELHVAFEVENNGARPLQLDLGSVRCEQMVIAGAVQAPLEPLRIDGDGTAPPGTTARADFLFETAAARPSGIEGFAVCFLVRDGEREALRQVTPFGPWERAAYPGPYPCWGAWAGGWGWGWGYAWYPHPWYWH